MPGYWSSFTGSRISRRHALRAGGAFGLSAAFLAACGGSDSGGSTSQQASSSSDLVVKPTDSTSQAKRGGVLKDYAQAEPRSLDPSNPQADYNRIAPFVYNTLLTEKPGKLEPSSYVLQGQLAQSYEVSGDGLQITMKMRPGVKWHNRPPVSGRAFDADDVIFSLNR